MIELLADLERWGLQPREVGRTVVVRTLGSAPRSVGASMLVAPDGRIAGSVSGGCVESAVVEEVGRARQAGRSHVVRYGISDQQAWDVGLACGGTIDVLVEPMLRTEVVDAARERGRVVVTAIPAADGANAPPTLPDDDLRLRDAADEALRLGRSATMEVGDHAYFIEAFPARPRLFVVGAVEVARPLVTLARTLGYETIVAEARAAFAARDRFPDADQLIVAWPDEAAEQIALGPADAVVVLTHDPRFDEPALAAALTRGCRYVGALGSRRTQALRRERLLAAGLPGEAVDRIHGPIGLDLGGREPAETALAIMAEVIATRNAATSSPGGAVAKGVGEAAPVR